MSFAYDDLSQAVAVHAAIRRRRRLQPVGGKGDKIFPPTYPGEGRNAPPVHVFERRRVDGREAWCVLIDSVQSQANRLEESLLTAVLAGTLSLPYIEVDFAGAGVDGLGRITSLDAPHRVYDAILRDSLLDGKPFMESKVGERLRRAKPADATALLEVSPTALIFGAWHSQGEGGGLGAKFPRCIVSEIIGVDTPVEDVTDPRTGEIGARTASRRTGSRVDPLGILRKVEVFKGEGGWSTNAKDAGKGAKKVRPSEINHGNIVPSVQPLGVTMEYAEQTAVITFAGLRRLSFGGGTKDASALTYLAALALLALAEQDVRGYALRSRCDLVSEGPAPLELVHTNGATEVVESDLPATRALYAEALQRVQKAGFSMPAQPVRLAPQPKLVDIVRQSQERALAGEGGEENKEE